MDSGKRREERPDGAIAHLDHIDRCAAHALRVRRSRYVEIDHVHEQAHVERNSGANDLCEVRERPCRCRVVGMRSFRVDENTVHVPEGIVFTGSYYASSGVEHQHRFPNHVREREVGATNRCVAVSRAAADAVSLMGPRRAEVAMNHRNGSASQPDVLVEWIVRHGSGERAVSLIDQKLMSEIVEVLIRDSGRVGLEAAAVETVVEVVVGGALDGYRSEYGIRSTAAAWSGSVSRH